MFSVQPSSPTGTQAPCFASKWIPLIRDHLSPSPRNAPSFPVLPKKPAMLNHATLALFFFLLLKATECSEEPDTSDHTSKEVLLQRLAHLRSLTSKHKFLIKVLQKDVDEYRNIVDALRNKSEVLKRTVEQQEEQLKLLGRERKAKNELIGEQSDTIAKLKETVSELQAELLRRPSEEPEPCQAVQTSAVQSSLSEFVPLLLVLAILIVFCARD
uniref:Centromere protein U n=1 Tax=Steinernema glaseri TaxID=37863 RepID=A0A1I8ACW3_9BILA